MKGHIGMVLMWNRKEYCPTMGNNILVIEDNAYVLEAFNLLLANSGYQTRAVCTAEEALTLIRKRHFDIIISDYRLPGMDGIEFFSKAKRLAPNSTRILISAYGIEDIASRAEPAGVHFFFEKPFSIQALIARLPGRSQSPKLQDQHTPSNCERFSSSNH